MVNANMTDDSVPITEPPRRTRFFGLPKWFIAIQAITLIAIVAAVFLVQVPYYLIQPGSLHPAEQKIDVIGAETYETDGEILFATITQMRATPFLLLRAEFDDAIDIRSEQELFPGGTQDQQRRANVFLMDQSKLIATYVALDWLGHDVELESAGVAVISLVPDSPASEVLFTGDVIVSVDGTAVSDPQDIGVALNGALPGETVEIEVQSSIRGDETETLKVELIADENDPKRPLIGISGASAPTGIKSAIQIDLDSGDVSGPSAGLSWTLAIIDRLTPGSLVGGSDITATGTIRQDGTIGQVGGLPQKVAAVKRAGQEHFLFPAETPESEQELMARIAGDDLELHPVGTIDEAVKLLESMK